MQKHVAKSAVRKILNAALTFFRQSTECVELVHIFGSINFFYSSVVNTREKFTTDILPDTFIFILGKINDVGQLLHVAP